MRHYILSAICFLFGHLDVSTSALPPITRMSIHAIDPDIEITLLDGGSQKLVLGATRPLSDTVPLVFDGRQPLSIEPR